MKPLFRVKVQLTPNFFSFNEIVYFSQLLQQKIILIDKIPAMIQAFKVVIPCPMTEHSGIWVGLLVMSSKDMAQNTQETCDWILSTVKTYLRYLYFIFYQT